MKRVEVQTVTDCVGTCLLGYLLFDKGDFLVCHFDLENGLLELDDVSICEPAIVVVVNQSKDPGQGFYEVGLEIFGLFIYQRLQRVQTHVVGRSDCLANRNVVFD